MGIKKAEAPKPRALRSEVTLTAYSLVDGLFIHSMSLDNDYGHTGSSEFLDTNKYMRVQGYEEFETCSPNKKRGQTQ